jgi:hypothetical protein
VQRGQSRQIGLAFALVLLGGGLAGCGAMPPLRQDCDAIILSWTPEDLRIAEPGLRQSAGGDRVGTVTTQRGVAGRELSVLSGVAFGDVSGSETGEEVVIGAQRVPIRRTGDTHLVYWLEAPPEEPCHAYAVYGVKVTAEEFKRIASGIEVRASAP